MRKYSIYQSVLALSGTRLVFLAPCPQLALTGGACCRPVLHTSSPGNIPRMKPQEVGAAEVTYNLDYEARVYSSLCVHKCVSCEGEDVELIMSGFLWAHKSYRQSNNRTIKRNGVTDIFLQQNPEQIWKMGYNCISGLLQYNVMHVCMYMKWSQQN